MSTPIDSLRPGNWVTVTWCSACPPWAEYNGTPHRVVHMGDMPFLVVEDVDGTRHPIDVRVCDLQRVSKKYVEYLTGTHKQRKREETPDDGHHRCVRCGERTVQRNLTGVWYWYCSQCDADCGEVEA